MKCRIQYGCIRGVDSTAHSAGGWIQVTFVICDKDDRTEDVPQGFRAFKALQ
jgi:hypothetical protein